MQVNTCIKELAAARGVSLRGLSAALGRSSAWGSRVSGAERSPALATVADVADVLGYDLAVVDRETGETIGTLDAPRRGADVQGGGA